MHVAGLHAPLQRPHMRPRSSNKVLNVQHMQRLLPGATNYQSFLEYTNVRCFMPKPYPREKSSLPIPRELSGLVSVATCRLRIQGSVSRLALNYICEYHHLLSLVKSKNLNPGVTLMLSSLLKMIVHRLKHRLPRSPEHGCASGIGRG